MKHPFSLLRPEYERDLALMRVTRTADVDKAARDLLKNRTRYQAVSERTSVPLVLIAALHMRESSGNFSTYLGNGEPLTRKTKLVPKGRGPFATWEDGALDAIWFDQLDMNEVPWSMPYCCYEGEAWNGFGPRNRGKKTGYLWSGTSIYTGGKYVADGVWSATTFDKQLGIVPVMLRMIALAPDLAIPDSGAVPVPPAAVPLVPTPDGVGGGKPDEGTRWVQASLNRLGFGPLVEDDSYGRRTRAAVKAFQKSAKIDQDGLAGPITKAALRAALKVGA